MDFRFIDVGHKFVRELNPVIALEARDREGSGRNPGPYEVTRFHRPKRIVAPKHEPT